MYFDKPNLTYVEPSFSILIDEEEEEGKKEDGG